MIIIPRKYKIPFFLGNQQDNVDRIFRNFENFEEVDKKNTIVQRICKSLIGKMTWSDILDENQPAERPLMLDRVVLLNNKEVTEFALRWAFANAKTNSALGIAIERYGKEWLRSW